MPAIVFSSLKSIYFSDAPVIICNSEYSIELISIKKRDRVSSKITGSMRRSITHLDDIVQNRYEAHLA